jgi:hypothetical protein
VQSSENGWLVVDALFYGRGIANHASVFQKHGHVLQHVAFLQGTVLLTCLYVPI